MSTETITPADVEDVDRSVHLSDLRELVSSGGHPFIKLTFEFTADEDEVIVKLQAAGFDKAEILPVLREFIETTEGAGGLPG